MYNWLLGLFYRHSVNITGRHVNWEPSTVGPGPNIEGWRIKRASVKIDKLITRHNGILSYDRMLEYGQYTETYNINVAKVKFRSLNDAILFKLNLPNDPH